MGEHVSSGQLTASFRQNASCDRQDISDIVVFLMSVLVKSCQFYDMLPIGESIIPEQHTLETEVASLEASIQDLTKQTEDLLEPHKDVQEKVEQLRERLHGLRPDAAKQEHLRAALMRIEDEIAESEKSIQSHLTKKKGRRTLCGVTPKQLWPRKNGSADTDS